MIEFNFNPFEEATTAKVPIEFSAAESPIASRQSMLQNYLVPKQRPQIDYSKSNYSGMWHSPVQEQYYYPEPEGKSYAWLWIFPISLILGLVYYYWKEPIANYFDELFSDHKIGEEVIEIDSPS